MWAAFSQRGSEMDLRRLAALPFTEAKEELTMFGSYERTEALVHVMLRAPTPTDAIAVFLDWGNMCDAPWPWRSQIADILRQSCAEISLADALAPDARGFYDSLPDLISVYRGCERCRERGLHWTTDKAVAEQFAKGRRCVNKEPTLAQAQIPKRHVFAVFVDRQEHEIVLDPRHLKRLSTSVFKCFCSWTNHV
jgi:hypothetical protein